MVEDYDVEVNDEVPDIEQDPGNDQDPDNHRTPYIGHDSDNDLTKDLEETEL